MKKLLEAIGQIRLKESRRKNATKISDIRVGDIITWTDGLGNDVSEKVFKDKRGNLVVRPAIVGQAPIGVSRLLQIHGKLAVK